MDFDTYLTRLPKVDLHNHVVGALRPATLARLSARHGLTLPRPAEHLYDFADFDDFLVILRLAALALRQRDDFATLAYEAIEDGHRAGNLAHVEFLFNPQYFYPNGVTYAVMVDGLRDGLRAGLRDFGVSALLVPSFDRLIDVAGAMEIMDHILAYRPDEVVGIGLDGAERTGPPGRFVAVYQRAAQAGLKRTAHVCEDNQTLADAPPRHYDICRDDLACDRLDHGYNLLADPATIARARRDGLFFNTCTVTSVAANLDRRRAHIVRMVAEGLKVTINTDDPMMFKTDIGQCYTRLFAGQEGWGPAQARTFCLNGVEASWLDPVAKAALRMRFEGEIAALDQAFGSPAII